MSEKVTIKRRNTKSVGFSEAEYAEIDKAAKKVGMFPRVYLLQKHRGTL